MGDSLEQAFLRRFSFTVIVSILIFALLSIHASRQLLMAELEDKGEGVGRILSAVVLDSTLTHDYAAIERYVREISRDSFVVAVKVVRSDGTVLSADGDPSTESFAVSYPIKLGNEIFGVVELELSLARVQGITWRIVGFAAVALILFHLIGVYVTRLLLKRTVLNPLAELRETMGDFGVGHFRRQREGGAPDELRAIVAAFNNMASGLEKSFDELEQQRSRLATERQKLAAIVNNIADGLFVTDNQSVIQSFNPSAERITGYDSSEAEGRSCHDVFQTSLCNDACAQSHSGKTMTGVETTLVTKDGRMLQVAVSSAVFCDDQGEYCGGVQTLRDITEEKMRHELFCRTEKMAAIGQLAAGVAHEINTPLANIIGYARLLRPGDGEEQVASRREVIIEQAEKCHGIVRGLLDYARSSDSVKDFVDVNEIMSHVIQIMDLQIRKKGITLRQDLGKLPLLTADPRKVDQLFFNLLLNALQAVGKQGSIEVCTWVAERKIMLSVADSGPGIPRDLRCRIFDPFYTTKPVGQGTGLGLSICAGIIDELQGIISIEDSRLGGARFIIELPVND